MPRKGPESKFRQKICNELKQCNAKIINIMGGVAQIDDRMYGQEPGISDVIMVHRYTGVTFLEFKAEKGVLSALQKRFLQEVNERVPCSGFVVRKLFDHDKSDAGIITDENGSIIFGFMNGKELLQKLQQVKSESKNDAEYSS